MSSRIERLKVELERLEGSTTSCHPDVQDELRALIDDMKAHLTELESAQADTSSD